MVLSHDDINRMMTTCGSSDCRKTVTYGESKVVSRPYPYKPGTKIFYGMPTTEEIRVCQGHKDADVKWPERNND
jgi:hypothetical protein